MEKAPLEKWQENQTRTVSQRPKERLSFGKLELGTLRAETQAADWAEFQRQGAKDVTCESLAARWWGQKTKGEGALSILEEQRAAPQGEARNSGNAAASHPA